MGDFQFSQNLEKLVRLQGWTHEHLPYWRFQRWTRSKGFAMWFYSPDQAGGRISKRHIQKVTGSITQCHPIKRAAENPVTPQESSKKRRRIKC
jgi:hypothetical protein